MVYIILATGFEEAEALIPADILRRGGVEVALTGVGGTTVTGGNGITVVADTTVEQVELKAGDMLVIPGGGGGVESLDASPSAKALIRRAAGDEQVWLAAICAAPVLLARMGLLNGVPAVCYPEISHELAQAGGLPQSGHTVFRSGHIITGQAPGACFEFGFALLEVLTDAATAADVQAFMHVRL